MTARLRDVAAAEDALSEALLAAHSVWPRDGLPQNPEAWLLTAARHSIIDLIRHAKDAMRVDSCLAGLNLAPRFGVVAQARALRDIGQRGP